MNGLLGGDDDFWVEHEPYDPVDEHMMETFAETGAWFVGGNYAFKGIGKVFGSLSLGSRSFFRAQNILIRYWGK